MTESFSSRLNVAMAFRNVKQIDFVHAAEKFNIKLGKSHMSQYVSGKTVPRADIAHFLAAFLQVNEDWLMGKDVPMEQNAVILPAIESDETQPDSNSASAQSTEGKTMRTLRNPISSTMCSTTFVARWRTRRHAWKQQERIF